jgi:hypothetical protein
MDTGDVVKTMVLLQELPTEAPTVLKEHHIPASDWDMLLRAAVESMRGTYAATTSDKRRFIEAVLDYGVDEGAFSNWSFVGTENRQDYKVDLSDGTEICIEAKGCPDGNNTTIWDRPAWADEFVVWCLCPESLVNPPGEGVWSGVATRLLPKVTAEHVVVDAMLFWDGRCGSSIRRCPKRYGVTGALRAKATEIPAQQGKGDWLPPPCMYLFPASVPNIRNNRIPRVHTVDTCRFANAMLELFNVPAEERPSYVHEAHIEAEGSASGTRIKPSVVSRCWPDREEREVTTRSKLLRRE